MDGMYGIRSIERELYKIMDNFQMSSSLNNMEGSLNEANMKLYLILFLALIVGMGLVKSRGVFIITIGLILIVIPIAYVLINIL